MRVHTFSTKRKAKQTLPEFSIVTRIWSGFWFFVVVFLEYSCFIMLC